MCAAQNCPRRGHSTRRGQVWAETRRGTDSSHVWLFPGADADWLIDELEEENAADDEVAKGMADGEVAEDVRVSHTEDASVSRDTPVAAAAGGAVEAT